MSKALSKNDITIVKSRLVEFWLPLNWVFCGGQQKFFRRLEGGGLVVYRIDMDNEMADVQFWEANHIDVIALNNHLVDETFEREVLNVKS